MTPWQRDRQSVSVIRDIAGRLDTASARTGLPVAQIVALARSGSRQVTTDAHGHDYDPFDPHVSHDVRTVTVRLPDMRLWDKAIDNLGLGGSSE